MWQEHILTLTTAGGAGTSTATASTQAPVRGFIEAIQIDYVGTFPATTDLTISEVGGMARTILTLTNINADKQLYPMVQATDGAGAAIAGVYRRLYIPGEILKVVIAQADDALQLTVRIHTSEY